MKIDLIEWDGDVKHCDVRTSVQKQGNWGEHGRESQDEDVNTENDVMTVTRSSQYRRAKIDLVQ